MRPGAQMSLWQPPAGALQRWSVTRGQRLTRCRRQYYLYYFATRPEYPPVSAREKRELLVLRSLRTRHMWVGQLVHALIERVLKAWRDDASLALEEIRAAGLAEMRQQYSDSRNGRYREQPLRYMGLLEHEYEHAVSRDEWQRMRDHVETCLQHFFALDSVQALRSMPRWRWLAVEDRGHFDVPGARIVVRPDLAWRAEDGSVQVVDWKTGATRGPAEALQLGVYGLYAERAWGLGGKAFFATAVHLADNSVSREAVERDSLRSIEAEILGSVATMRDLQALGPQRALDHHPMTDDRSHCTRCPFRRVCGR